MAERRLTAQQETFAREYLVDLNATQAAIRAGYSARTAESQGSRLLRNAKVQALVSELRAKREAATDITAERVLEEIARFAFGDIRGIFDPETGALKHPATWDKATAAAIASVEVVSRKLPPVGGEPAEVEYVHKIKTVDKAKGLEMLGKHLAMFTDKTEHSGTFGVEVIGSSAAFDDPEDGGEG